jgi:hypothetical protein
MAQAPSTSRLRVVWALDAYMMRPRRKNGKTLAIQTRTPTISHKHHDIPKTLQTLWPQKQQRNKKQPRKKVTKQLHYCMSYQSSIVSTGIRTRLIAPDELSRCAPALIIVLETAQSAIPTVMAKGRVVIISPATSSLNAACALRGGRGVVGADA